VTEIYVLAFLILAIRLVSRRDVVTHTRDWLLLGVVWACLLQADIYQAVNLTLVALLLGGYFLIAGAKHALRGIPMAACAAAICSTPFLYQRLHELPDVPRRWGMFSSGHHFLLFTPLRLILLAFLVLFAGALLCWRSRRAEKPRMAAAMAILSATVAISLFSGLLVLLVLGKGIQVHHYVIAADLNAGYAVLLCCGWILQDVLARLSRKPFTQRLLAPRFASLGMAAAMLVCAAATVPLIYASFSEIWWGRDESSMVLQVDTAQELRYRASFSALGAMLERPEFKPVEVLGTFDGQLANWWGYRRKYLYLPDIFNTTVSDQELEARVYSFLHILGGDA
jgi:hypothetical protein